MAGLFTALNSARTSLEVNQKGIEITGNNIANVNTEGYSRQKAELAPYPAMNFGGFFVGQGVKVQDVRREHDVFITAQMHTKAAEYGFQEGQARSLGEIERVFNITEDNLATDTDKFFDSWQELSASPADLVLRDTVIQSGDLLSTNFKSTITELDNITSNINDEIFSKVDDINSQMTEIADLNERIFSIEIHGQMANSARDRRDVLAQELAQSIGAQNYQDSKGMMTVQLPGGLPLVVGNSAMSVAAVTNGSDLTLELTAGGATRQLSGVNLGGEVGGLVHIKETFIPQLREDLDTLAFTIATEVNTMHNNGMGLDGYQGNFFELPPNYDPGTPALPGPPPVPAVPPSAIDPTQPMSFGAARSLAVAITDAASVAAGNAPAPPATVAAPGDNRNALELSNLGEDITMGGIDTFNSFYGKLTSRVGLEKNHNQLSLQGAEDAMVQLQNVNDGMVGVSLEEEMISLIQYQRGFESSAKFLSTVDELMNTLINIRR